MHPASENKQAKVRPVVEEDAPAGGLVSPDDNISRDYTAAQNLRDEIETRRWVDSMLRKDQPAESPEKEEDTDIIAELDKLISGSDQGAEKPEETEDFAFRGPSEIPRATWNALVSAGYELSEGLIEAIDFVGPRPVWTEENLLPALDAIKLPEPESPVGQASQTFIQFMTGFVPAMRATKFLQAYGKAGKIAQPEVAGVAADLAVMDEQDQRFSDWVQKSPFANVVNEYLAGDDDDPILEQKLKMALDGALVGGLATGAFHAIRFFKQFRAARKEQARATEQDRILSDPKLMKEAIGDPLAPMFSPTKESNTAAEAFLRGDFKEHTPFYAGLSKHGDPIALKIGNINMSRMGGPEDVRQLIGEVSRTLKESKLKHGVRKNEQTIKLANELGLDPERLGELFKKKGAFDATELTAIRILNYQSTIELGRLRDQILSGNATDIDKLKFKRWMAFHSTLVGIVSEKTAEAGRALQSFKILASSGAKEQNQMMREILHMSERGMSIEKIAEAMKGLNDPAQMANYLKKAERATTWDILLEARYFAMLSGPQTHAVNIISNAAVMTWAPVVKLTAAAGRALVSDAPGASFAEAKWHAYGLIHSWRDAFRLAGKTWWTGDPSDAFSKIEVRRERAISGENVAKLPLFQAMGLGSENAVAAGTRRGIDVLATLGRKTSIDMLQAGDDFFKLMNYRAELYALSARQASAEGLRGKEFAKRVHQLFENPPEDLHLSAMNFARYATFTKPLGESGGRAAQTLMNRAPWMRLVVPFFRTPVNIVKMAGEHTPFALLSENVQKEIVAGGARRDIALAKIGLGTMAMLSFSDLANNGFITGGGPKDKGLRQAKMRLGWQPYSFKLPKAIINPLLADGSIDKGLVTEDKTDPDYYYVAFNRLDPVGMVAGIAADMSSLAGLVDAGEMDDLGAMAVMAIQENMVSKTYLKSVADLFNIFNPTSTDIGVHQAEQLVRSYVTSLFTPALFAQATRVIDPKLRHVESVTQALLSRTPTFSDDLPPILNLWGYPIELSGGWGPDIMSPLWISPLKKDHTVDEEFGRLGWGPSMPQRTIDGVEMTQEEYNTYVVAAAQGVKHSATGLNYHDLLKAVIEGEHPDSDASIQEKRALQAIAKDYAEATDAARIQMIRKATAGLRQQARAELLGYGPKKKDSPYYLEDFSSRLSEQQIQDAINMGWVPTL